MSSGHLTGYTGLDNRDVERKLQPLGTILLPTRAGGSPADQQPRLAVLRSDRLLGATAAIGRSSRSPSALSALIRPP
jgi:hypothetical protein